MRSLDDLKRDIELAGMNGNMLAINRAELRMLKDYNLVEPVPGEKDVVTTNELFGGLLVRLHVVEVLP